MNDDHLYLKVTDEVTNGKIDPALWAKAIAKALGDEDKGKYEYINLRVEQLKESNIDSPQQDSDERFMPPGVIVTPSPNEIPDNDDSNETFSVLEDEPSPNPSLDSQKAIDNDTVFKTLIMGKYGLAKTYWVFGIGIMVLLYILSNIIGTLGSPTLSVVWVIGLYAYQVIVWIAIWRASGLYSGPVIWSGLAKFAVVIGILATLGQLNLMFNP